MINFIEANRSFERDAHYAALHSHPSSLALGLTGVSMDFSKIAPYLHEPLVLIGFIVFLGFSLSRYLVKKKVISELPPKLGFVILKQILAYGFIIGLLSIALGFGLKYRELSAVEQDNAFQMLKTELRHNLVTVSELAKNMENIVGKQKIVSEVLRTKE